ncbi:hypothetical protein CYLTODRAFT_425365 [Cylindrobasidium torrendii FP15055 ss-10]|uniref:Fungal-type protein kinase domain-containing protein n=1 Tax=Cylindrobasidium torrendii FP15055 ss-10 TaxID=1314674 RepID=A0A0D7B246_9AGAR|nr:hypothetical protein CYLTODRAFT_425365 [Cylindrobasidium torrendii FP15055 ss-10]
MLAIHDSPASSDREPTGVLIDWESPGHHDGSDKRFLRHAEKREFMSARILIMLMRDTHTFTHTVGDDMESFIWILVWIATFHAPNTMRPDERYEVMQMFDSASGRTRRAAYFDADNFISDLKLKSNPFSLLLYKLFAKLQTRYLKPARLSAESKPNGPMETHAWMINAMEKALEDEEWKSVQDSSVDNEVEPPEVERHYLERKWGVILA